MRDFIAEDKKVEFRLGKFGIRKRKRSGMKCLVTFQKDKM